MAHKDLRLIFGVAALLGIYAIGSFALQTLEPSVKGRQSDARQTLVKRGQELTENCMACHYMDQKANFVGPHLVGLIGRPVADVSDFEYSPAVRKLSGSWTEARLTEFLTAPQRYAPGTKMALQGWAAEDAKAIAAYFESRN